jgi:hypothetical protein
MAFNYSPKIVTDGLVLYLDAANTRSYPTTGTTWSDLSRSGNNGTLVNGPTFNSSNGGSIVFDGVNDGVSLTNIGTDIGKTYNIWVKNTSSNSTLRLAYAHRDADRVYIGVNGIDLYLRVGTDSGNLGGTTLSINQWFNLCIRLNTSTQYEGFVNGVSIGTRTTTLSTSIGTGLGAYYNNTNVPFSNYWIGDISQVSIYNRALTAQEILQNYNATKSRYNLL